MLRDLLSDKKDDRASKLRACLRIIENSFPADAYFADAASDNVEFRSQDPERDREVLTELINALKGCGLKGSELRGALKKTEYPSLPPELVDELLNSN